MYESLVLNAKSQTFGTTEVTEKRKNEMNSVLSVSLW